MKTGIAYSAGLFASIALALSACGSSSDEAGLSSSADTETSVSAPEETTTTVGETTTTVAETTTTVEETTTTAAATDEASMFDSLAPEEQAILLEQLEMTEAEFAQFEALLDTDVGKEIMAQGIVESTTITIDQALCIIENGDILGLMVVGASGDEAQMDGELMSSFLQTLDTCGIPLSAFGQ